MKIGTTLYQTQGNMRNCERLTRRLVDSASLVLLITVGSLFLATASSAQVNRDRVQSEPLPWEVKGFTFHSRVLDYLAKANRELGVGSGDEVGVVFMGIHNGFEEAWEYTKDNWGKAEEGR